MSELGEAFIMRGIEANVTSSNRGELEKASATWYHIQVHLSKNNVSTVKLPLNYTSPPSMVATFLATYLIAVLQPSRYSVFHDRVTPISVSTLKPLLGAIGVLPLKP